LRVAAIPFPPSRGSGVIISAAGLLRQSPPEHSFRIYQNDFFRPLNGFAQRETLKEGIAPPQNLPLCKNPEFIV
jgi:hypothetical protein